MSYLATDWGRLECEDGAFEGVPSRIRDNIAVNLAQREWVDGKMAKPISRAEVVAEVNRLATRIRPQYHPWESDAAAEASAIRKALTSIEAV